MGICGAPGVLLPCRDVGLTPNLASQLRTTVHLYAAAVPIGTRCAAVHSVWYGVCEEEGIDIGWSLHSLRTNSNGDQDEHGERLDVNSTWLTLGARVAMDF